MRLKKDTSKLINLFNITYVNIFNSVDVSDIIMCVCKMITTNRTII